MLTVVEQHEEADEQDRAQAFAQERAGMSDLLDLMRNEAFGDSHEGHEGQQGSEGHTPTVGSGRSPAATIIATTTATTQHHVAPWSSRGRV
jgi:hypothetical protein